LQKWALHIGPVENGYRMEVKIYYSFYYYKIEAGNIKILRSAKGCTRRENLKMNMYGTS
jgi:hypothetical protein